MKKIITQDTNVLEQVIDIYNSLEYLFHFLKLNPGYNIFSEIYAGSIIIYDFFKIGSFFSNNQQTQINDDIEIMMYKNQDLFDIAISYYNDIFKVIDLMNDNGINTLNKDYTGTFIVIKNPLFLNRFVRFIKENKLILATGLNYIKYRAFNISFNQSFN